MTQGVDRYGPGDRGRLRGGGRDRLSWWRKGTTEEEPRKNLEETSLRGKQGRQEGGRGKHM